MKEKLQGFIQRKKHLCFFLFYLISINLFSSHEVWAQHTPDIESNVVHRNPEVTYPNGYPGGNGGVLHHDHPSFADRHITILYGGTNGVNTTVAPDGRIYIRLRRYQNNSTTRAGRIIRIEYEKKDGDWGTVAGYQYRILNSKHRSYFSFKGEHENVKVYNKQLDSEYWYIFGWRPKDEDAQRGILRLRVIEENPHPENGWSKEYGSSLIARSIIPQAPNLAVSQGKYTKRIKLDWSRPNNITSETAGYYELKTYEISDGSRKELPLLKLDKNKTSHRIQTRLNWLDSKEIIEKFSEKTEGYEFKLRFVKTGTFKLKFIENTTDSRYISDITYKNPGNEFSAHGYPLLSPLPPKSVSASLNCENKIIDVSWESDNRSLSSYTYSVGLKFSDNPSFPHDNTEYARAKLVDANTFNTSFELTSNQNSKFIQAYIQSVKCEKPNQECILSDEITHSKNVYVHRPITENVSLSYSIVSDGVSLSWNGIRADDPNVLGYDLYRTDIATNQRKKIYDDSDTTYLDTESLKSCGTYTYSVVAKNECFEATEAETTVTITPSSDLDNTFTASLNRSGEIRLDWDFALSKYISSYRISRKLNSEANYTVIQKKLTKNSNYWEDTNTESNLTYEYKIVGLLDCGQGENENLKADSVTAIGIRQSYGTVSGNIHYLDGSGVENAKVTIDSKTSYGNSFNLNSSRVNPFTAPINDIDFKTGVTIEFWLKNKVGNIQNSPFRGSPFMNILGFKFFEDASVKRSNVLFRDSYDLILYAFSVEDAELAKNFNHYAITFQDNSVKLYINGTHKVTRHYPFANIGTNYLDQINISQHTKNILIDELKVWNEARTNTQIRENFKKILVDIPEELVAYYKFDRPIALNYVEPNNKVNNAETINSRYITTSSDSPKELMFETVTDRYGNYTLDYIPYSGTGTQMEVTPHIEHHSFKPSKRTLFIGDGARVHNNVDFTDISSFKVTGTVRYKFKDTNCFVKDVEVLIDGKPALLNGEIVKTDAQGFFTINVPVGRHRLSVRKEGHVFDVATWPSNGTLYDFTEPVSGIDFFDNTLIKVAGKIVGGTREGSKPLGLDGDLATKNNIGQAQVIFRSQKGDGCISDTVYTDSKIGEYEIKLPPLKYEISEVNILSNQGIIFENEEILNLSNINFSDSVAETGNDTFFYHKKRNFIYRSTPALTMVPINENKVFGEYVYDVITKQLDGSLDTVSLSLYNSEKKSIAGHPIYLSGKEYDNRIKAFESYVNNDNPENIARDTVPLRDGVISVHNDLANELLTEDEFTDIPFDENSNGEVNYSFTPKAPNLLAPTNTNKTAYTKTLNIKLRVGNKVYSWLPNNDAFRAFVFGKRAVGKSFVTYGPQTVDMVLRDPPGNNSFAYIDKGSTTSSSTTHVGTVDANFEFSLQQIIGLESEITLPFGGPIFSVEALNKSTLESAINTHSGEGNSFNTDYSFSERLQTSSGPLPGSQSDLYIGKSNDFIIGKYEEISIELSNSVSENRIDRESLAYQFLDEDGNKYRLVKNSGIFMNPKPNPTNFYYTQEHIENYLINDLKELRNNLFSKYPSLYISKLEKNSPRFGLNNDDNVFSKDKTSTNEPSYEFKGVDTSDSVRILNQQIRLWEEAIKNNEKEKLNAVFSPRNTISYNGISIDKSYSYSTGESEDIIFEQSIDANILKELDQSVSGLGAIFKFNSKGSLKHQGNKHKSETSRISYGYHLEDNNTGDYFRVAVSNHEANASLDSESTNNLMSPVFKLEGGASMCPWERPQKTKYYKPGSILSAGTRQRELPEISADVTVLHDVPENESAIFRLNLGNASETNETQWYHLRLVDDVDGLALQYDGEKVSDIPRLIELPGGKSSQITLDITKYDPDRYDFEDIKLMLYSSCEWDSYTNGAGLVSSDTVTLAAHFVPVCQKANILKPKDLWIANISSIRDNQYPITFNSYDPTDERLEKITIQYKPKNRSSWSSLRSFYKTKADIPVGEDASVLESSITTYAWNLEELIDGEYQIRALSFCNTGEETPSEIVNGLIDRTVPRLFGSTNPADGVLDVNDKISLKFNEPINESKLTLANFDIRGILNFKPLNHQTYLSLDDKNSYAEIPRGLNFVDDSFTIEFWAKAKDLDGRKIILSQGDYLSIFRHASSGKLGIKIKEKRYLSDFDIPNTWAHYAFTYDSNHDKLNILVNGRQRVLTSDGDNQYNPTNNEPILIGKSNFTSSINNSFVGDIHELRIWNQFRSSSKIIQNYNISLSGKERGLIGYWPFDAITGDVLEDKAHYRHAVNNGGSMKRSNTGYSARFGHYVHKLAIGDVAFDKETDFTIEFWFNKLTNSKSKEVIFTNKARSSADNSHQNEWTIYLENDDLWLEHNNLKHKLNRTPIPSNGWQHLSISVNRLFGLKSYRNGVLEVTKRLVNDQLLGFGAAHIYIGGEVDRGTPFDFVSSFDGLLDEVRIWDTERSSDQIKQSMNYLVDTTTFGLRAYLPYEEYLPDAGVNTLRKSLKDYRRNSLIEELNVRNSSFNLLVTLSDLSAPITLTRPVEKVNFNYTVNQDEIVFELSDDLKRYDNRLLNFSVKNIEDQNGNKQSGTISWSAFVNRNELRWDTKKLSLEITKGEEKLIKTAVINNSGQAKSFNISGIPNWMDVDFTSGDIKPRSRKEIIITVKKGLNTGIYRPQLNLNHSGLSDIFAFNLKVNAESPNWSVDKRAFEFTTNIIGELSIGGKLSTDEQDLVAVVSSSGEIRGVARPKYIKEQGRYLLFLTAYTSNSNETLQFKIWDASEDKIYSNISESFKARKDRVIGSLDNPYEISAGNTLQSFIRLNKGINWVSFNLLSNSLSDLNLLFENDSDKSKIEEIRSIKNFSRVHSNGFVGELTTVSNDKMYQIKATEDMIINIEGTEIPDNTIFDFKKGWNWLSYTPLYNMTVNEALARFTFADGDIIKSQSKFAVYDKRNGWIGNLEFLEPTKGYKLNSAISGQLSFPKRSTWNSFARRGQRLENSPQINVHAFEHNMSSIVEVSGLEIDGSSQLKAYVGDELRGVSNPIEVDGRKIFFLSVHGNESLAKTRFEITQDDENLKIHETVEFKPNLLVGSVESPFRLSVTNRVLNTSTQIQKDDIKVYPNPFTDKLKVSLGGVKINFVELYNYKGDLIFKQEVNNINFEWKAYHLALGIYFIKVTDENSNVYRSKLLKR